MNDNKPTLEEDCFGRYLEYPLKRWEVIVLYIVLALVLAIAFGAYYPE